MKPRTLAIDTPLMDLVQEIMHTQALLRAYPFLQAQADQFDGLYADWLVLLQEELALERERYETEARAVVVDDAFDLLCTAISATILAQTGGIRKTPLYERYFKAAPSQLKRPVLGEQLETMRTWPPSLQSSDAPALQGYGTQLAARVIEGDAATRALSEGERKRADFELGPRKAFVDKLNAARQGVYGQLAELPHKQPDLMLPRDFANRFFLRGTSQRVATIPEVEQSVLRLREKLRKQEELLARLVEEEEEETRLREDAEIAAAEAELAEAERKAAELAEAERKAAELQERMAALKLQRKTKPLKS